MPYRREYVMPGPRMDLKFNFGGTVSARRAGANRWEPQSGQGWCMGLWDEYHSVCWPADVDYIGVSFRPGGFFALFGIDAHELGNETVAVDALLGPFALELRERLAEAPNVQARFALLENMLAARLPHARRVDRIAPALEILNRHHGMVRIADLAAASDVSKKHLVTLFNRIVGIPPKRLALLYRVQHLLGAIETGEPRLWTEFAQDFDYYDQAHFNKDFKRATGHTPARYVERRRQAQTANPDHAKHFRLLPQG
ncbi:MAG: helix-turn-helix transcriptional regulator [Sphingosinicella sp.]|nr:helix-turn-helix transcriptional regulator [Sphingosinicella sp.]